MTLWLCGRVPAGLRLHAPGLACPALPWPACTASPARSPPWLPAPSLPIAELAPHNAAYYFVRAAAQSLHGDLLAAVADAQHAVDLDVGVLKVGGSARAARRPALGT